MCSEMPANMSIGATSRISVKLSDGSAGDQGRQAGEEKMKKDEADEFAKMTPTRSGRPRFLRSAGGDIVGKRCCEVGQAGMD